VENSAVKHRTHYSALRDIARLVDKAQICACHVVHES